MWGQTIRQFLILTFVAFGLQACSQWPLGIQTPSPSDLNAQHAEYDGDRVRVTGLLIIEFENVGLYESLEAYYRYDDDYTADRKEAWISIMLPAEILQQRDKYDRSFVRVTGTFDDACHNFAQKGAFQMCKGTPGEGTLVDVQVEEWLSPPWQRLGHDALGSDALGLVLADYRIMTADWAEYDPLVSLSRDWLMAVQAKDAEAVLSLEGAGNGKATAGGLPTTSAYYDLFFGPASRFQQLTPLNLRRQVAVLTDLEPGEADGEYAQVCYCTKEDCTGEWPLARQDLYSDGPFPYVCTSFSKSGGAWHWDFR